MQRVLWGNLRERDHWGDPDVDGRIILKLIFRTLEGVLGTGWSWLRLGTSGGSNITYNLLLAQHVLGTTMTIIRSSRVLYKWLLPVVFGALVFKLSVWCGAEGCVSGFIYF